MMDSMNFRPPASVRPCRGNGHIFLMKQVLATSWVRVPGVAVALLLAGELVGPARLAASCGDYVTVAREEHPTKPVAQNPPAPQESSCPHQCSRKSGQPGSPCRGPMCSEQKAPLSVPPVTTANHFDHWALAGSVSAHADGEPRFFAWRGQTLRPIHRVDPIYHPPRV
jgi:hypothetical protein